MGITAFTGKITLRLLLSAIMLAALAAFPHKAAGQQPLSYGEKFTVVTSIASPWTDWQTMTLSGKFKMAGLPLSPSVKIFMEKDSLVRISLRAPFMGEVGRAEIDRDSILIVNKMKKTFVKESISGLTAGCPVSLSDIQSLLLGRVTLPGAGILSGETASMVELFPEADGEYSLVPGEEIEILEFNYGYLIDADARPSALLVIPVERPDTSISLEYEYGEEDYNLTFSYISPDRIYNGELQLGFPQPGGSPMEPVTLGKKYTRLSFSRFLKSF